ncbi:hypothetical protein RWE87_13570 [Sinorhizobium meliloti]|uniref:hypothetical protein n=1 Tax=Rhizobium meliloti TaxID=382 RepID=UPI00299E79B2|nr:hypothetical protein [Sinorhizobium meliloti]
MTERSIHEDILRRYDQKLIDGGADTRCEPVPGTHPHHLRWMLQQLYNGNVTGEKAHRWLGFIQGVMIVGGWLTVQVERDFTRPYFTEAK